MTVGHLVPPGLSLEVGSDPLNRFPHATVHVDIGKISGTTLAAEVDHFSLHTRSRIRSYEVVGPELAVWVLGLPPNTKVPLEAWVFLN